MTDDGGWQRLHPLSPLLRGGVVLLAVGGYVVSQLFDRVMSVFDTGVYVPGGPGQRGDGEMLVAHPFLALAAVVVLVLAVAAGAWVSWRFTRFRVADGQVELRQGVVFRQHRQVRLERVQAVETTRPLLARLVGLSQVVVQSAGGSDSHLTLAFLGADRAEEVRVHLLELAGRVDDAAVAPDAEDDAPGASRGADAGVPLVVVPNGRLFVATILHGSTIVLGIVVLGVATAVGVSRVGLQVLAGAPALVPVVLGLAVGRVKELLVHGNFSVARTATALRVRHGLTDLRVSSVPVHRVQALEAVQPLWWRPWGWWRVRVNVAGVHGEDDGDTTTLLPVGTREEALRVLGALGVPAQDPLVVATLDGSGPDGGWVGPPRVVRWLDPWAWRRIGYALAASAVHVRSGRLTRRAVFVPYARVQSLGLEQGPLQARLGVASARVVSTPGPVSPLVPHLATAEAERLLGLLAERSRVARRVRAKAPGTVAPDAPTLVD
ncbi:PH domain-containing protein [Phycicoccus flavus]|uniref:PH domain-containing protein n=1 Tax=Phycicoccus flavus TaxID=2502783 RepID=A0A8T6RA54_9MICO|nr:PH domain-containing protein [Phycicoccus flavus]NHA69715.1 PH domain-containing protein [Phycicoccus flavus]